MSDTLTVDTVRRFSRDSVMAGARALRGDAYEIVHVHSSSALPLQVLARAAGKRVVVHSHAHEPLRPVRLTMMRNAGMLFSHRVVTVSHFTANELIRSHHVPPDKVKVCHNGVDMEDFRPDADASVVSRYGLGQFDRIILSIGTVQDRKGQLDVIECLPRLLSSNPNLGYVNVGPTPDPTYTNLLLRRSNELHVSAAVMLLSDVPQDDLRRLIGASKVCVHASRREAFGLAVVEEMACGKPVVSYRIGGIPEIIDNEIDGLLVTPGDRVRLCGSIERLLSQESLAVNLGRSAREKIVREFTWDVVAKRLETIYSELRTQV